MRFSAKEFVRKVIREVTTGRTVGRVIGPVYEFGTESTAFATEGTEVSEGGLSRWPFALCGLCELCGPAVFCGEAAKLGEKVQSVL